MPAVGCPGGAKSAAEVAATKYPSTDCAVEGNPGNVDAAYGYRPGGSSVNSRFSSRACRTFPAFDDRLTPSARIAAVAFRESKARRA